MIRLTVAALIGLVWLPLLYLAIAFSVVAVSGVNVESSPVDHTMKLTLMILGVASFAVGTFLLWLRRRLFWRRKTMSIEQAKGSVLFVVLYGLQSLLGYISMASFEVPLFLWGIRDTVILAMFVAIAFAVMGFPILPREDQFSEKGAKPY